MAGIYIHIPYCRKACHYCNFHFSVSLKSTNDFIPALLKEAVLRQGYLGGASVDTVYFGGGTPSLLGAEALESILATLRQHYPIAPDAEITLEANPDDIDAAKLGEWKALGVNRLSIGVQSFFEADLQWMNRAHTAEQAQRCIVLAKQQGFDNISIDLIYGTPGLTHERWRQNLQMAVDAGIAHLSCYALTVEPGTALNKLIAVQKKEDIDPEIQAAQFLLMVEMLETAGYRQYEISNFSLPGSESRHNSSYWKGTHYLGLGPSAHSFDGHSRQWNVSNNGLYIAALSKGELLFEREELTPVQRLNEYIMTSLRTSEGIDLNTITKRFGADARARVESRAKSYLTDGRMRSATNFLLLNREGRLFADGIAAALFD